MNKKVVPLGILFHPHWTRVRNGQATLCVRITVSSQRKTVSLKQKIDVAKWNKDKECLQGADPVTKSINNYIDLLRGRIHDMFREMQRTGEFISAENLKNKVFNIEENHKSLNQVIEYHNSTMKETLTWGTAKNYYTTQRYIKEFLKKQYKKDDYALGQLSYKFLTDFEMFLRVQVPGANQKACGNNTVMKHIERFRKIISMAVRNEWLKTDPFIKFKPKFVKKERGFLTQEELLTIETKPIDIARVEIVRDLFVFSCYTGLAYTDAYNLTPDQIQLGINGKKWIIISRQKTGVQSSIPLLPKALEIIEKYKDHPKCKETGKLLPMIANQPFNYILKEIAVSCGITKNLSHHLARHTFATTVCLINGVSFEGLMQMMGHTKISTTQVYGKVLPQRVSREMEDLESKLKSKTIQSGDNAKTASL